MMGTDARVVEWLMEGDAAIRWQVRRDLLGEKPAVYEAERAKMAEEGWGARLLSKQAADGSWGGGDYSPKFISTHYTLLTLMRLGMPPGNPQALKGCQRLLDDGRTVFNIGEGFPTENRTQPDICVLGMKLGIVTYFGLPDERVHRLAAYVLEQQMADEGWNCRHWRGDTHSSFHSTCSVLEGLWHYQQAYPKSALPLGQAQAAGREFLLQHRLYKSHRSGEVFDDNMTQPHFPPQWRYDFLKALDYFQLADAAGDERAGDAIELLLSQHQADGRWLQAKRPSGKFHFTMEAVGKASRGNTLRALRVLKWWNSD